MSGKLTIIDYGIGNLFSVARAFEHVGAEVTISSDAGVIKNSSHVILPGVGAFKRGMEELHSRGLVKAVQEYATSGKPLMGICLGMQMLFETGEENGTFVGLGIIKGKVSKIPTIGTDGAALKVPHIGWTKIHKNGEPKLLAGLADDNSFYFVHSYQAVCADDNLAAYAIYGGNKITACVSNGNVFGCQFHPEKSAENGLKICRSFMEQ